MLKTANGRMVKVRALESVNMYMYMYYTQYMSQCALNFTSQWILVGTNLLIPGKFLGSTVALYRSPDTPMHLASFSLFS